MGFKKYNRYMPAESKRIPATVVAPLFFCDMITFF